MGYKSASAVTKQVDLATLNPATGRPYRAVVRALRGPEEDAVQAALLGSRTMRAAVTPGAGVTGDIPVEFDSAAEVEQTLLFGVESWDLDGEEGDDVDAGGILRITPANLQVLTGGDRNTLYLAIKQLTTPPSQTEKED